MILSGRLKAIASAVPRSGIVADIGTDHGYIPLYLIQYDAIDRAIAADISAGSLKKAELLIQQYNLSDQMETRLGNGLSVLTPGEVDTIIIAGMGGMLIRDILTEGDAVARAADTLILQPMVAQDVLREWLNNNDYTVIDEDLVREDQRYYEIMIVKNGREDKQEDIFYDIGWKLIEKRHPLLEEYIMKKIGSIDEIINNLKNSDTPAVRERIEELKARTDKYEEVLRWIKE